MQTGEPVSEVFFALCKSADTPVSLGAWLRYKYSHIELSEMKISPNDYTSASSFSIDYACVSFLSKWKGLNTGNDLEKEALLKFTKSEDQCRKTNEKFRNLASLQNGDLHAILHRAQRKIASLLGPFSMFCIADGYGWGPGATFELPRRRAQVDTKMCELPITVSITARDFLKAEIERDLHWSHAILGHMPEGDYSLLKHVFAVTRECRIDTVPKNAKTHRVIAIEPRGNSFLQKGFGDYFRKRLRSVGVNLDDQGVNQELARRAYSEQLATLDLRAASDTVATEVVFHLLPVEWALALDSVRSRWALMPSGESIRLEKFSSMGNGFTFELESLLFWALCSAATEFYGHERGTVAVYGDDLIVEASLADKVSSVLTDCGFEINDDKSYKSGPFFESCGKHYFMGVEVTPAYQKEEVVGPLEAFRLGNRLIRLAFRLGNDKSLDIRLRASWLAIRRIFAETQSYCIPFGVQGDDGWSVPFSEFPFHEKMFDQNFRSGMGFRCKVLRPSLITLPGEDHSLYAWSLRLGSRKGPAALPSLPIGEGIRLEPKHAKLVDSYRRVIPDGRFSVAWH